MKRNESDRADFPGDCGDLLVFSSHMQYDCNELGKQYYEGTASLFLFPTKVKVPSYT